MALLSRFLHLPANSQYSIFPRFICTEEEITDDNSIANLAAREPNALIYTRLGLTYGKALRFRKEFETKSRIHKTVNGGHVHVYTRDETILLVQVSYRRCNVCHRVLKPLFS